MAPGCSGRGLGGSGVLRLSTGLNPKGLERGRMRKTRHLCVCEESHTGTDGDNEVYFSMIKHRSVKHLSLLRTQVHLTPSTAQASPSQQAGLPPTGAQQTLPEPPTPLAPASPRHP